MFHPCPLVRFSVRETFNLWLFLMRFLFADFGLRFEFFLGVRLIDWIGLVSWLGDAAGGR